MPVRDIPGACKTTGLVVPVIDRNTCEGKEDCIAVCPYSVFTLGVLDEPTRASLSFIGKLKAWGHGYKQAFVTNGDACRNCGKCVTACPEKAITLKPLAPAK